MLAVDRSPTREPFKHKPGGSVLIMRRNSSHLLQTDKIKVAMAKPAPRARAAERPSGSQLGAVKEAGFEPGNFLAIARY